MIVFVKAAADAVERYMLETGVFPSDWESLDIQIPGPSAATQSIGQLIKAPNYQVLLASGRIVASKDFSSTDNLRIQKQISPSSICPNGGCFDCYAYTDKARVICQTFGPYRTTTGSYDLYEIK